MSESSNIRSLPRPDGSRPRLRDVIRNDATDPDEMALRERVSADIRRVWPQNTEKNLARALGRTKSTAMARAIIECRRTISMNDMRKLSRHPEFGRRSVLRAFDYPEEPDYTAVLESFQKLRERIAEI